MSDHKVDANFIVRTNGHGALLAAFDRTAEAPVRHVPAPPIGLSRIRLVPWDQIKVGDQQRYLVKGLIPRVGLTVVWGPPKSGKSFWVFDLMMHVALGWDYRDRRVDQGAVVYCAFEGQTGIETRVEAFRQRHLASYSGAIPFYLEPVTLDLVNDHGPLISAIKAELGEHRPVAVVFDTLNRSLAGSESRDEDMAAYIKAADAVREAFECAIIIVHHCGIAGNRPRGHTSLSGAADAQIAIGRDGGDNIIAKVELAKDGAQGETIASRLEVVEVGTDEDGETITSCVIVSSAISGSAKGTVVSGKATIALDLLRRAIAEKGTLALTSDHIPGNTRTVPVSLWRKYCYDGTIASTDKPDTKQKAFIRALETLQRHKLIGVWEGHVWII